MIKLIIMHRAGMWSFILPSTPIHQWHYWSVTYTSDDVNVYINGCNTEPFSIKENKSPRAETHTEDAEFHTGDWYGGGLAPHVTIDEMMVWYRVLTADQIYVQGGILLFTPSILQSQESISWLNSFCGV